jgi:hypothetical protein
VERWDGLEGLVIQVFRGKGAETADESIYKEIRPWLVENYPLWENELRPYWQTAKVGGQTAVQDPFLWLLRAEHAQDFVGDWEAMQYLPAAREGLNRYIQAVEGKEDET